MDDLALVTRDALFANAFVDHMADAGDDAWRVARRAYAESAPHDAGAAFLTAANHDAVWHSRRTLLHLLEQRVVVPHVYDEYARRIAAAPTCDWLLSAPTYDEFCSTTYWIVAAARVAAAALVGAIARPGIGGDTFTAALVALINEAPRSLDVRRIDATERALYDALASSIRPAFACWPRAEALVLAAHQGDRGARVASHAAHRRAACADAAERCERCARAVCDALRCAVRANATRLFDEALATHAAVRGVPMMRVCMSLVAELHRRGAGVALGTLERLAAVACDDASASTIADAINGVVCAACMLRVRWHVDVDVGALVERLARRIERACVFAPLVDSLERNCAHLVQRYADAEGARTHRVALDDVVARLRRRAIDASA